MVTILINAIIITIVADGVVPTIGIVVLGLHSFWRSEQWEKDCWTEYKGSGPLG